METREQKRGEYERFRRKRYLRLKRAGIYKPMLTNYTQVNIPKVAEEIKLKTNMTYSFLRGLLKGVKYAVIFLIAGLVFGLPVEWRELTLGGILVLVLNAMKVRWDLRLP